MRCVPSSRARPRSFCFTERARRIKQKARSSGNELRIDSIAHTRSVTMQSHFNSWRLFANDLLSCSVDLVAPIKLKVCLLCLSQPGVYPVFIMAGLWSVWCRSCACSAAGCMVIGLRFSSPLWTPHSRLPGPPAATSSALSISPPSAATRHYVGQCSGPGHRRLFV